MSDDLLSYYNKELSYIRKLGAEFAEENPKIAGRLRMKGEHTEDPHVSRLIEAFAFISARIRHKLDDHFPELTDALMGVVCPDYQAPIPSMSIVNMKLGEKASEPFLVEKGMQLAMQDAAGRKSTYKITHDLELLPIDIVNAKMQSQPIVAPAINTTEKIASVLRIDIHNALESTLFSELKPNKLRFFINAQPQYAFKLYELIYNNLIEIKIALSPNDRDAITISKETLEPVGFTDTEALLDYSRRGFSGNRVLSESYVMPEKFLFFEVDKLTESWDKFHDKAQIYLYFNETEKDLEQYLSKDNFLLNCMPVINLFDYHLDSVPLTNDRHEYHLVTSQRNADHYEIQTVNKVWLSSSSGQDIEVKPFYGYSETSKDNLDKEIYWVAKRRDSEWVAGRHESGSEVYLSLIDTHYKTYKDNTDWTLHIQATCVNRNLPSTLPFGNGQPEISLSQSLSVIDSAQCLIAPTNTLRPPLKQSTRWQLISHLSLDYFTEHGLNGLKNVLLLYNYFDDSQVSSMIEGIVSLEINKTTSRIRIENRSAIAQGNSIKLELDKSFYSGSSAFFFASILDRFFAQYCSINSFTQMTVWLKGRDTPLKTWPARNGMQQVL